MPPAHELADIQAQLLEREPIFHKPELGTSREDYAAQMEGPVPPGDPGSGRVRSQLMAVVGRTDGYAGPSPDRRAAMLRLAWMIEDGA